eukprot:15452840-Alexandrium_andersonii.AAC.1
MNHPAAAVAPAAMINSAGSNAQGWAMIDSARGIGERAAMKDSGRAARWRRPRGGLRRGPAPIA